MPRTASPGCKTARCGGERGDYPGATLEGEERRIGDILADADAYHWVIELDGQQLGNINLHKIANQSRHSGRRAVPWHTWLAAGARGEKGLPVRPFRQSSAGPLVAARSTRFWRG